MGLKLLHVKGNKVLCETPLSPKEWVKDKLEEDFESLDEELQDYTKILLVFMNENRVLMLRHLLEKKIQP